MADQTRDKDADKSKKPAEQLDEKELDQVSGGHGGGVTESAIKIDLGPHGNTNA